MNAPKGHLNSEWIYGDIDFPKSNENIIRISALNTQHVVVFTLPQKKIGASKKNEITDEESCSLNVMTHK